MSSIVLSAGSYTLEVGPAATVTGLFEELDATYNLQIDYYNNSEFLTTRPTVENGTISEFPRFT